VRRGAGAAGPQGHTPGDPIGFMWVAREGSGNGRSLRNYVTSIFQPLNTPLANTDKRGHVSTNRSEMCTILEQKGGFQRRPRPPLQRCAPGQGPSGRATKLLCNPAPAPYPGGGGRLEHNEELPVRRKHVGQ